MTPDEINNSSAKTGDSSGEVIEVKKPAAPPAPTEIVINSEDGTIMNAADVPESTATPAVSSPASQQESVPSSEPTSVATESAQTPVEAAPVTTPETSFSSSETAPNEPPEPSAEPSAEVSSTVELPQSPESTSPNPQAQEPNPMAIPPQAPAKPGAPKAAIIVAVVIALLLAAVSVFAFLKLKQAEDHVTHDTQKTEQTTEPQKQPLTAEEVDAASKEIEAEINKTNDDADLPAAESVTDTSLGL